MKQPFKARCADIFKMLTPPDNCRSMRLIDSTIYLNMVIECEHVQLKVYIGQADKRPDVERKIEEGIEAVQRRIERDDSTYEHPSVTQGRAFDRLTC